MPDHCLRFATAHRQSYHVDVHRRSFCRLKVPSIRLDKEIFLFGFEFMGIALFCRGVAVVATIPVTIPAELSLVLRSQRPDMTRASKIAVC